MFYKFTLPEDYSKQIFNNRIKAVSYTEFENEPSLVHSHKNVTEVIFVVGGEGLIAYRDTEINISPNNVYFINPNTEHTEISRKNLRYFVIRLSDFEVLDKNRIPIKSLEIPPLKYREIIELLTLTVTELNSPSPNTAYSLALLSATFFRITEIVEKNASVEISDNPSVDHSSTVQACINYIDVYFSDINILDDLRRKFNLSGRSLERAFKRELNVSPLSYIKSVRTEKAESLLLNTSYSVSQIAAMCGYTSFAYFSKEFKTRYGLPPSLYRKTKQ